MATATVQIPATGTYRIDPAGSSVSFTTRHLFGLGVVRGTFGVLSGEVTIADPVTASTARAVIDAASFSGGVHRWRSLLGRWNSLQHPDRGDL